MKYFKFDKTNISACDEVKSKPYIIDMIFHRIFVISVSSSDLKLLHNILKSEPKLLHDGLYNYFVNIKQFSDLSAKISQELFGEYEITVLM